MTWFRRHSSLALVGGSLLFALFLAEVVLRLLGIGYGNAPMVSSSRLHHLHPSQYEYVVHDPAGEYGGYRIYFDGEGYRVPSADTVIPKPNGERRIAFLGDSFTESLEAPWNESFIGQLATANPKVTMRNFGVQSYSPILYLAQARKDLREFAPTDVVLQLYSNDFASDHDYLAKSNSTDLNVLSAVNGDDRSWIINLLRYSYLARLVRKVQLQLDFVLHAPKIAAPFPDQVLANDVESLKERQLSYQTLSLIRQEVTKQNARFYVLIIPNKGLSMKGQCCSTDTLHEEVCEFAQHNNISFIDLGSAFGQQQQQSSLFLGRDIHLAIPGHTTVARSIALALHLRAP